MSLRSSHTQAQTAPPSRNVMSAGMMELPVSQMMSHTPVSCDPRTSVEEVAQMMRAHVISSVLVMDDTALLGIVTVHDLVGKVLAQGRKATDKIALFMTANPVTISQEALGLDAMALMARHRISHLPVVATDGQVLGMIGRTDLFRQQSANASWMGSELLSAPDSGAMAQIMSRMPVLLRSLSAAGVPPHAISRRITDLTDASTRRLLALAEEKFGPPPVAYVWAACGSQGRYEQTGVSDQDNCLILDDAYDHASHGSYFEDLARFVSDGLNQIGYVYCPGDMMATNPKWRQSRSVWRAYFAQWISQPDETAQMLASVMFDLRAIDGDVALFADLQSETLAMAGQNSIFLRHMASNTIKHAPPLGLWRQMRPIRSGPNKGCIDLKHAGVVPITDLGRAYALKGGIAALNTRARIMAAGEMGIVSAAGARDLIDAYDLISEIRLDHQAALIEAGRAPDNFINPKNLSGLNRSHLRDAFLVVKTMQLALEGQF